VRTEDKTLSTRQRGRDRCREVSSRWIGSSPSRGFRPANNLRTALAAAEDDGYDLIISDLELGDGTGLDLLNSLGPGRSVPAIVLTGYGSEEDRKMCLEAGFEMHIVKPVLTRQLSEAIRFILQKQSVNS
jgi:DNA-binding response OmpR family regulator